MDLPEAAEFRALLTRVSERVAAVEKDLVALAERYGVHGPRLYIGGTAGIDVQFTRMGDRWALYAFPPGEEPRMLTGSRIDHKIGFLPMAEEYRQVYIQRILELHSAATEALEDR
jgi:hypothetical protein